MKADKDAISSAVSSDFAAQDDGEAAKDKGATVHDASEQRANEVTCPLELLSS